MFTLNHMYNSLFDLYQIDVNDYDARLRTAQPTVSAILSCFMDANLSRTRKHRWAEKTPGHLKRFVTIRDCFPNCRFVCIFRDPRDVALSLLNVSWGTPTFMDGLLLWQSYYNYYIRYISGANGVLALRYEDLVQNPLATAATICSFLAESFDEGMRDTSGSAVDVGSSLEPYKENASAPVDATRAFAWRNRLENCEVALCDRLLRDALITLHYPLGWGADNPDASHDAYDYYRTLFGISRTGRDGPTPKI